VIEEYDQHGMRQARRAAIERARLCCVWGLVLGTLGRQGNVATMERLKKLLEGAGKEVTVVLMSEVTPQRLALMPDVEAWVQVACPRCALAFLHLFTSSLCL
jgi:2-(3-amino-3-carboxypropyl)histidine synthase